MRFPVAALCATALLTGTTLAQDDVPAPEPIEVPEPSSSAIERPTFTVSVHRNLAVRN